MDAESTDDRRWQIIMGQTSGQPDEADFIYAVVTTGIYCRPDCRSRRPNRCNVHFFGDWRSAERAGFRACMRCRPRGGDENARVIRRICETLDREAEAVPMARLAAEAGLSEAALRRLFRERLGMTPREFAQARRRRRLRSLLAGAGSVTEAFYDAGYGGSSRFYELDSRTLGMKPDQYRRGAAGETIHFVTVDSPLGRMLVARTPQGVCAIDVGDEDAALEAALRKRFDRARIEADIMGGQWREMVEAVVSLVDRPGGADDLPLDIRGTAFEEKVWQALLTIPCGETRSYSEVARMIGAPGSVRAVAGACARNPLLLAIPCHRVVREGGAPGGYRAGTARKARLLNQERKAKGRPSDG